MLATSHCVVTAAKVSVSVVPSRVSCRVPPSVVATLGSWHVPSLCDASSTASSPSFTVGGELDEKAICAVKFAYSASLTQTQDWVDESDTRAKLSTPRVLS